MHTCTPYPPCTCFNTKYTYEMKVKLRLSKNKQNLPMYVLSNITGRTFMYVLRLSKKYCVTFIRRSLSASNLGTNCFDISPRKFIFSHHKLFWVDIICQCHSWCVYLNCQKHENISNKIFIVKNKGIVLSFTMVFHFYTFCIKVPGKYASLFLCLAEGIQSSCQFYQDEAKAGSRLSILFVARITLTSPLESKPSNRFSNSNIVLWISRSPPECASYLGNMVQS